MQKEDLKELTVDEISVFENGTDFLIGKVKEIRENTVVLEKPHRAGLAPAPDGRICLTMSRMEFISEPIINLNVYSSWGKPDPILMKSYTEKTSKITIAHSMPTNPTITLK